MALIKCPECGKEISDTAKQCPNCGFVLKKEPSMKEKIMNEGTEVVSSMKPVLNKYKRILFCVLTFIASLVVFSIVWAIVGNDIFEDGWWWGAIAMLIPTILQYRFNITKLKLIWIGLIAVALSIGIIALVTPKVFSGKDDYWSNMEESMRHHEEVTGGSAEGTYSFTMEDGARQENYKVVLNDDMTAQLIYESGTVVYGSWDRLSFGPNAEFIVRTPTLNNPYGKGKVNFYFREGYVYHSYDQVKAKDPTNREPYTKTN